MKRIQTLPDLCLLTIFDRISLHDLTHSIARVCPRWHSLKKSAFKRRHHLALFVGYENPKPFEYKIEIIYLNSFTHSISLKVMHLFPNVTYFTIQNEFDISCIDLLALTALFTHRWSSKLTSLELLITLKDVNIFTPTMIGAINSLSSLKRLWLACSTCDDGTDFKPQFPIIAQLEQFHLNTSTDIDPISYIYATSLQQIQIDTQGAVVAKIESLLKLSPQLAHKFIKLYSRIAYYHEFDNSQLTQFCAHFISLQTIDVVQRIDGVTLSERLTCLSPLKQLNRLNLYFHTLDRVESPLLKSVEPFVSVHKLTLGFNEQAHRMVQFMNSFNFVHFFPKLEFVMIFCRFRGGDDDNGDEVDVHYDNDPIDRFRQKGRIEVQMQKSHYECMIEPLKKCEHLQEILYMTDDLKNVWTRKG